MTSILSSHRWYGVCTFVIIAFGIGGFSNHAEAQQKFNAEQKQEVETIVKQYLLENPEVIVDAIRELRRRDENAATESRKNALGSMHDQLKNDASDPVIGNPNGDVTVVEFFDYRCGYCKKVFPDVMKLLKDDGNIKYILKEWPILGDDSIYASRAALAVWFNQREKYTAFHTAMMGNKGGLSNERVVEHAKNSGVNVDKMLLELSDKRIDQTIENNNQLASKLGITGTPAFIFGSNLLPGAIDFDTMKQLVVELRDKN